ncbi:MAG: M3 family oligoendopeptidase [candidate division NC10 bacterium]|nr:M3 family oligoendopeptidase [candidate division NC10 bacterium]
MSDKSSTAAGVRWDLSDLFASPDDPRLGQLLTDCQRRAEQFAERHRTIFRQEGGPDPATLREAIQELEAIHEDLEQARAFAGLLYAADTQQAAHRDLRERVELKGTAIGNTVLFFELDWIALSDLLAEPLLVHPALAEYRHYLAQARKYRPHTLSEPEEQLLNERDNTGRWAFGRLFTELLTSLGFPLERDGKTERLTLSEMLALAHDADRDLRRQAHVSVMNVLSQHALVLTFVYDTLLQDHLTADRLRRYPHPMAQRHLGNQIDDAAVQQMLHVTEANYPVAQRYFRLKARLLGLPRLSVYDQYAPVGDALPRCPFARSREIVLEAFAAFSPVFREAARQFFDRRWIDAEIRPGKQDGAFCASPSPSLHPYVLCNYADTLRDVMTVAHELGHGLHGWLSRRQRFFNYDTPLTLAETASVFGEFLVFDHLLATETDPRVKLALLCGKIEDTCATVFRQALLTRFEQAAFARRPAGRLTSEAACEDWLAAHRAYYGDAVEMTEQYRWGWSYIPHFIHTRFYCYSYVFGELLVLSLYRQYKAEGNAFVPKYLALLEAGGSDAPEVLLGRVGVDIRAADFWQQGLSEIQSLVERAEAAAAELGLEQESHEAMTNEAMTNDQ